MNCDERVSGRALEVCGAGGWKLGFVLAVLCCGQWRIGILAIEPELRDLHWMSDYYQPAPDQAMAILTVRFPAGH